MKKKPAPPEINVAALAAQAKALSDEIEASRSRVEAAKALIRKEEMNSSLLHSAASLAEGRLIAATLPPERKAMVLAQRWDLLLRSKPALGERLKGRIYRKEYGPTRKGYLVANYLRNPDADARITTGLDLLPPDAPCRTLVPLTVATTEESP